MSGATYLIALGVKISMAMVMMLLIGLLFLVLGNYFLFLSDLQKEKLTAGGKSLTVSYSEQKGRFLPLFLHFKHIFLDGLHMLRHTVLRFLGVTVYNGVHQSSVLIIHIFDRLVFHHDLISCSENAGFDQLISGGKNTVKHRIVCNFGNFVMKLLVEIPSGFLIL